VLVLGMVTATGGGTLRDVLLGDFPPFCLKNEVYLAISIAVALAVFFQHQRLGFLQHPLLYFDAVGLGTFVVIGTGKALEYHMGFIGAVIMGIMTATAGGVVRDVLSNRVPLILRKEVYASACLAGGALMFLLHQTPLSPALVATVAALTVITLRLLAIRHNWSLPRAQS